MLQKLEQAGFEYSAADRLRAIKLLDRFAIEHLDNPQQLKYRLAPILTRNKNEQERFYRIYEAWWKSVQKEAVPVVPKKQWNERLLKWLLPLTILATLVLLGLGIRKWLNTPDPVRLQPDVQHEARVTLGDTIFFNNISQGYDTASTSFHWERYDATSKALEERVDSQFHYAWHVDTLIGQPKKEVILYIRQPKGDTTWRGIITVDCAQRPADFTILSPPEAQAGELLNLSINRTLTKNERLTWSFGDGEEATGAQVRHRFSEQGVYNIRATIIKDAPGSCELSVSVPLSVGNEQAPLAAYLQLEKESVQPSMHFTKWTWWLMGLLLLPILYLWWRWWSKVQQQKEIPPPTPEERQADALDQLFHAPDKAPYTIPYRDRNSFVRSDASLYRFANLLRQRQEGFRKELDIPSTIRQTIERAGFPLPAFRTTSVPSEYLFLVDDFTQNSHQKQLFDYLIQFLRDKDIHLQAFHYEKSFDRFWNDEFPTGIDLERIHRLYPHHRLVVMGDGHGLLKPFGGTLLTQPHYRQQLAAWRERMLLTPVPVASWTFQEKAIYEELMAIFPANMDGFQSAMVYLEL
ncbi:MAG: PKD domain-containing protein, partial [Myxococcota bacterium]